MSTHDSELSLLDGWQLSGMTAAELWSGYYAIGGDAGPLEVEAYTLELLRPDDYEHNLIAQAINEHFLDRGLNHPVRYRDLRSAP